MRVPQGGRKEGGAGLKTRGWRLCWRGAFPPNLFLIAVSSNGIRVAGEMPNIRVALVRVRAHATGTLLSLSTAAHSTCESWTQIVSLGR